MRTNFGDILDATERLISTNQSHKYSRMSGPLNGGPWVIRRRINLLSGTRPADMVGLRPPREQDPDVGPNVWCLSSTTAMQDRNQTLSFFGGSPWYVRQVNKKSCDCFYGCSSRPSKAENTREQIYTQDPHLCGHRPTHKHPLPRSLFTY
jgi:hypothetical protein